MAKKVTARDIIQQALVKCNAISPGEIPDDAEISDGLDELNNIFDTFNQEELFSYTYERIRYKPLSNEISIGDDGADRYDDITNDQYKNTINLYEADYSLDGKEISITGIEDDAIVKVRAYGSDTQYKTPTTVIPDIDLANNIKELSYYNWVVDTGVDYFQAGIADSGCASFTVGDVVCVTDAYNFSLIGIVHEIVTDQIMNIEVQDEVGVSYGESYGPCTIYPFANATVQEYKYSTGYIYDSELIQPDIVAPRPFDVISIIDVENSISLGKIEQHDFLKNKDGLTYSKYFTYFTDMPFGVITLTGNVPSEIDIQYNKLNAELNLDDKLVLPAGYKSALIYELSRLLASEYGQADVAALTREAGIRMSRLFNRNFKYVQATSPCIRTRSQL